MGAPFFFKDKISDVVLNDIVDNENIDCWQFISANGSLVNLLAKFKPTMC